MSDTLIVLHTAIAILAIVLLIVVAKVDPVPSLVIGTLYLGVTAGLGFGVTIETLVRGFGDIMAEVQACSSALESLLHDQETFWAIEGAAV